MKRVITNILIMVFMTVMLLTVSASADTTTIHIDGSEWRNDTVYYSVTTERALSGTLICGMYDENGCMVGIGFDMSDMPKTQWNIDVSTQATSGTVKFMLWDSLTAMEPLSEYISGEWSKPTDVNNKILVAYFAYSENIGDLSDKSVDAIASASIGSTSNTSGNIQVMANAIQEKTNADIHSIVVSEPYDFDYDVMREKVYEENANNINPILSSKIDNLSQYDVIFLGTPVWAGKLPPPMRTFIAENDLSGKTIIPFGIHLGSGWGSNINELKAAYPNSTFLDGLTIRASTANNTAKAQVDTWLAGLGY